MDGLRPEPSASPVLPETRGSGPALSPLLYSAQRFRMVSSLCLSCDQTQPKGGVALELNSWRHQKSVSTKCRKRNYL